MRVFLVVASLAALVLAGCVTPAVQPPAVPPVAVPSLPPFLDVVKVGLYGNEPVVRVAPEGTVYVAALHYLYVSTDGGATFKEADFKGAIPVYASDSALAVSPQGRAYIAFDWPYAGQTAVCTSSDRGATWSCAPIAVPGATDRMWLLAPTEKDVYLITGQTLDRPTFAVSHDAGATWSIASFDAQTESQGADLAWDPAQQLILEAASSGDGSGAWGVRSWKPDGTFVGFAPQDVRTQEPTLAVDEAGVWWATACGGDDKQACPPAVARSEDRGQHWTVLPVPFGAKVALLPFVAAGSAGHAAMAWYETNATSASDKAAEWRVVVARTVDAGAHWASTTLTVEPVHKGAMCSSATCLGEDRYAGDFLGLAYDTQGDVHVTWVRQTGPKLLPTGQQPPPLPSWERVEYARTR